MSLDCNVQNTVISNTPQVSKYSEYHSSADLATSAQGTLSSSIRRWQQTVSAERAPDDHGIFARCFHSCVDVYNPIIKKIQDDAVLSSLLCETVRELFNRFIIWGETVNVRTGKLDTHLLQGSQVKKVTLQIIIGIGNTLSQDLIHYVFHSPAARKELLQSAGVTVLHDEAQYVIAETSDCHKCNAATATEDGLHGIHNILKGLDDLTKCLMSISGINLSNKNRTSSITSRSRSPIDFFSEQIHTKLPQADGKVVARLAKFYWDQFKRYQAAIDAPTQESYPSKIQADSISTRGTNVSKFRDSALGSSAPTEMANTETNITSFTGSSISKAIPPQFRNLYPCLFPGCCDEDTVLDSRQAWAEHFLITHEPQIDSESSNCPLCHANLDRRSALYQHYVQHMNDLVPTILTNSTGEGADDGITYHRSLLRPESDETAHLEHSQETPRQDDMPGPGGVNPLPSPVRQLTNLSKPSTPPTSSDQARSGSVNVSQAMPGPTLISDLRCHTSRFEAAPRRSSVPKKQSGQHRCSYRGCKLPKDFSGFKSAHDLKRHKRSVHREVCGESYMCAVVGCKKTNKSWPRCDNFKAHVKRMHPSEDVEEIIQRSRYSNAATGEEPADELSYQDDISADPNRLIHNRISNAVIHVNQPSQSFNFATSEEREIPELVSVDGFPWGQRHTSAFGQAATTPDYLGPFNDSSELDFLEFHSNGAESLDENLSG